MNGGPALSEIDRRAPGRAEPGPDQRLVPNIGKSLTAGCRDTIRELVQPGGRVGVGSAHFIGDVDPFGAVHPKVKETLVIRPRFLQLPANFLSLHTVTDSGRNRGRRLSRDQRAESDHEGGSDIVAKLMRANNRAIPVTSMPPS